MGAKSLGGPLLILESLVHSRVDDAPAETLTVIPQPSEWRPARGSGLDNRDGLRAAAGLFRRELGLPDGPVVMSGHQPEIWHAGILAKYFATVAAARAHGAAAAWVVVDQDTGSPERIRYPGANWSSREWRVGGATGNAVPVVNRRPAAPGAVPADAMCASVSAALQRLATELGRACAADSVAKQFTLATWELLSPFGEQPHVLYASDLARTALFRELVLMMRGDAARCVGAYNAAAARHPEAGVRQLRTRGDVELPLWVVNAGGGIDAATVSAAGGVVLPRALMMTAVLRAAGCEMFIHGLGGGVYDAITEEWMREWLGVELAPSAVVTATCYARPMGAPAAMDSRGADAAVWRAQRARHDPAVLGDEAAAREKAALLERVRATSGGERREAYRAMHSLLRAYRERHSVRLSEMAEQGRQLADAAKGGRGAWDRTWPFVFLSDAQIAELRDRVGSAFTVGAMR